MTRKTEMIKRMFEELAIVVLDEPLDEAEAATLLEEMANLADDVLVEGSGEMTDATEHALETIWGAYSDWASESEAAPNGHERLH
jgi:hypothetical protein